MPGTRHIGDGRTGRSARWLTAALLVPALAACGGGGGSDSGQTGNAQTDSGQSSGSQPDDQRTKAREIQGSFPNAGEVSASVRGSGRKAVVTVKSTSPSPVQALVSNVTDCTENAKPATPSSAAVTVTDSGSAPAEFTLPTSSAADRPICYTVTIDGERRDLQAEGTLSGTPSPGASTTGTDETSPGGTSPSGGPTSSGGGDTPYGSTGGTESGSTP
ncbi:hypothetical protein [Streptomyces sp. NRRL S-350]|uniref:hypothetical protein n=1 Tax=Streptomyces sp. NRRL S-350 TaxID=1463902 RepID=UPI0004BF3438|nr:hypothetical protein [Streptomyces sp. NRRL S-350]